MSRTFFIDTSFIVALVNKSDQNHAIAIKLQDSFKSSDTFYYTEAIMYESLNALSKRDSRALGIVFFEILEASPNAHLLHTTPAQFNKALALFKRHPDKEWGLVDCLSFLTMQEKRIAHALTADRHFEQAGLIAVLRSPESLT